MPKMQTPIGTIDNADRMKFKVEEFTTLVHVCDGTEIEIRVIVNNVFRFQNAKNQRGEPLYNFDATLNANIICSESLIDEKSIKDGSVDKKGKITGYG